MTTKGLTQKRRDEIKSAVLNVLKFSKIKSLPVVLNYIIKSHYIKVLTKAQAGEKGLDVSKIKEAKATIIDSQYTIIYDNTIYPKRIRWSLAHELGHIFLNHLRETPIYDKEAEANYFARELLAPLAVLDEIGKRRIEEIAEACNISYEAAEIRADDFKRRDVFKSKYGNTKYDEAFLSQFAEYINNSKTEYSNELCFNIL